MSIFEQIDKDRIPRHVAVIMDGNGRWAKAHHQERSVGHREGVVSVRKVIEAADKLKIAYLTLYTFSTENWNRPKEEVDTLMSLMVFAIVQETPDMIRNNIRLLSIGDLSRLPAETREAFEKCIKDTASCTGLKIVVAVSYSSRWEISSAVQKIAEDVGGKKLSLSTINEDTIQSYLTTKDIPDPDLLIRTGGEFRISNFLLWQLAYAEFYFTDIYWPEFREEEFFQAILEYQTRERRFGKTSEQIINK
ncbi:MAG: isoprenyl transferase [Dysgonamonadaceae bacterium]